MHKVEKIVDLSIPISAATPIYPGDPQPTITPAASIDPDGYNVSSLHLGSHTGTHVDAPLHFRAEGPSIDSLPLQAFIGEGVVIDVTGKAPAEPIGIEDIQPYLEQLGPGKIALIYTGWSDYLGDPLYFRHPYVDSAAIDAMLDRGIRTFLIDALNIDPPDGDRFPAHEKITRLNGVIGENFSQFGAIDFPHPWIMAFPLKIEQGDGSPVRAVAVKFSSGEEV
ncbi:cyclase family protein [Brevibacillus humidisoli]|uniref:cyclase family protein n=1 Tax=Brevibacillus humidisoli TaxID=2895522 RepID=UPI001E31E254|nr:cyclase family protein [Brevibacillus humidisoli]UFJ39903.1 cyclase family protein [Brevibacillus humidisoli]